MLRENPACQAGFFYGGKGALLFRSAARAAALAADDQVGADARQPAVYDSQDDQRLDFGDGNRVESNRGCSGIEGSTSTAIGDAMASAPRTVVLVTGDMSAAYDVGALAVRDIPDTFRMVVLDNGGGDIFRAVATTRDLPEREQLFAVAPRLPLKALSEAYGFRYFDGDPDGFAACPSRAVLHLHVPQGDCLNVM